VISLSAAGATAREPRVVDFDELRGGAALLAGARDVRVFGG
jgi:hypothetical protein